MEGNYKKDIPERIRTSALSFRKPGALFPLSYGGRGPLSLEITRGRFPQCCARLADVASLSYSAVVDESTEDWIVDIEELRSVLMK